MKALYDYEAQQPSELTVKEDEMLYVYDKDDDWFLVSSQDDGERVGYVPGNYVEDVCRKSSYFIPISLTVLSLRQTTMQERSHHHQLVLPSRILSFLIRLVHLYFWFLLHLIYCEQPPRPAYVDPADRVASNKAQADDIKTWAVAEVDAKGKKKKGTLGVGNGAIFFASESDKVFSIALASIINSSLMFGQLDSRAEMADV